jgi:primase-polymerase (primpol)-like protein
LLTGDWNRTNEQENLPKFHTRPSQGHRASASNPSTWGTLDETLTCAEKYSYNGIGFVTVAEDGIILIDIDNCLDENGQPNEIASDIIAHLPPTYIEISPSDKGLYVYLKDDIPARGNRNSKTGVEMYSSNRYFTLTGRNIQDAIESIGTDSGGLIQSYQTWCIT